MDDMTEKVRTTLVVMEVTTYGTSQQRLDSLRKLKKEIELQGFHVRFVSEGELT